MKLHWNLRNIVLSDLIIHMIEMRRAVFNITLNQNLTHNFEEGRKAMLLKFVITILRGFKII